MSSKCAIYIFPLGASISAIIIILQICHNLFIERAREKIEWIELPANLFACFSWHDKSNINNSNLQLPSQVGESISIFGFASRTPAAVTACLFVNVGSLLESDKCKKGSVGGCARSPRPFAQSFRATGQLRAILLIKCIFTSAWL